MQHCRRRPTILNFFLIIIPIGSVCSFHHTDFPAYPMTGRLANRYFARLQLDPSTLDVEPTLDKLRLLQEHHLKHIPFENTAQHGVVGGPAVLDVSVTADKILTKKRGGFCFELNGLFAALLEELEYQVTRVPSIVWIPGLEFQGIPSHCILAVKCQDSREIYMTDVGFGEPALHPLRYDSSGQVQTTPDGMQSKMLRQHGDSNEHIVLYWFKGGQWIPRLRWNSHDVFLGAAAPALSDFSSGLAYVQQPSSIFSQKLIMCLLTDQRKVSLAGNKLKITGPPRFPKDSNTVEPPKVEILHSVQQIRQVMKDTFGIPMESTEGLDLTRSLNASPEVWDHM